MRKTPISSWVKNVYNLGTQPGINSGLLSTLLQTQFIHPQLPADNSRLIPYVIPVSSSLQSTAIFNRFNLLKTYLSPLSTAPINKTKKKKERK